MFLDTSDSKFLQHNCFLFWRSMDPSMKFPGALPLDSEVFCWYPARHVWFSATIIHARPKSASSSQALGASAEQTARGSAVTSPSSTGGKIVEKKDYTPVLGDRDSPERLRSVKPNYLAPKMIRDARIITAFQWEGNEAEYDYYIHFHGEDR